MSGVFVLKGIRFGLWVMTNSTTYFPISKDGWVSWTGDLRSSLDWIWEFGKLGVLGLNGWEYFVCGVERLGNGWETVGIEIEWLGFDSVGLDSKRLGFGSVRLDSFGSVGQRRKREPWRFLGHTSAFIRLFVHFICWVLLSI